MTPGTDDPDVVVRRAYALRRGVRRRWMLVALLIALPIAAAVATGQNPPLLTAAVLLGLGAFANASIGQMLTQPHVNPLALHAALATDTILVAIFAGLTGFGSAPLLMLAVGFLHVLEHDARTMGRAAFMATIALFLAAFVRARVMGPAAGLSLQAGGSIGLFGLLAWATWRHAAAVAERVELARDRASSLARGSLAPLRVDPAERDDVGSLSASLADIRNRWFGHLVTAHDAASESLVRAREVEHWVTALSERIEATTAALELARRELDAHRDLTVRGVTSVNRLQQTVEEVRDALSEMSSRQKALATEAHGGRTHAGPADQESLHGYEALASAGQLLDALTDRVLQIGGLAESLAGLARQTHVLALNAAIEAAQSGGAGESVAVVADQIHALSGEAGQTAREAVALIGGLQGEVGRAIQAVRDGSAHFGNVRDAMRGADERFKTIDLQLRDLANRSGTLGSTLRGQSTEMEAFRAQLLSAPPALSAEALHAARSAPRQVHEIKRRLGTVIDALLALQRQTHELANPTSDETAGGAHQRRE